VSTVIRWLDGGPVRADAPGGGSPGLEAHVHSDDLPLIKEAIQRAVRTKGALDLEHRVRRADGSTGWAHARAVPLLEEAGEVGSGSAPRPA
jgi:PAS domain-containing protein